MITRYRYQIQLAIIIINNDHIDVNRKVNKGERVYDASISSIAGLPVQVYVDGSDGKHTLSFADDGGVFYYDNNQQRDLWATDLSGLISIRDSDTIRRRAIETRNGNTYYRLEIEADGNVLLWISEDNKVTWRVLRTFNDRIASYSEVVTVNSNAFTIAPGETRRVDLNLYQGSMEGRVCTGIIGYSAVDPSINVIAVSPTYMDIKSLWSADIPIQQGYMWVKTGWVSL